VEDWERVVSHVPSTGAQEEPIPGTLRASLESVVPLEKSHEDENEERCVLTF